MQNKLIIIWIIIYRHIESNKKEKNIKKVTKVSLALLRYRKQENLKRKHISILRRLEVSSKV